MTVPNDVPRTTTKGMINMGTNFNDLWNDSSFISEEQRNKIDFEVALIGKLTHDNLETLQAIDYVNNHRNMSRKFSSVDELMEDLNA